MSVEADSRRGWLAIAGACAGLAVLLAVLVAPISRTGSHSGRMWLAGVALLLFGAYLWLRQREGEGPLFGRGRPLRLLSRRWLLALLTCASITYGLFNYYQFDGEVAGGVGDYNDVTYYYLNSKYFSELGYFDLYDAMLIADAEMSKRFEKIREVRDLHSYQMADRRHSLRRADEVRARFSPERWREFRDDLDYLASRIKPGGWRYFFTDHGYNPPPPWTVVGGFFSRLVPVQSLKLITSVDTLLVIGLFVLIGLAFGTDTLLFALLFFLVTFSGRWPILGQSLLRFDWLSCLVAGMCFLKMERPAAAGAVLAYAALNRVFPAIFFFPAALVFGRQLWVERRLSPEALRFIAGAGAVTVLLLGIALVSLGPQAFVESKRNLSMHASAESFSSHRVGLGDALVYRGEVDRKQLEDRGGLPAKRRQLERLKVPSYTLGFLALLLIAWWFLHRPGDDRPPAYALMPFVVLPLFCLTNPQINYYNLRLLLVAGHMSAPLRPRNLIGLTLLFVIEIVTQWSHVEGQARYATTSITSVGLLLYFAILVGSLALDLQQGARFDLLRRIAERIKWPLAAAASLSFVVIAQLYWSDRPVPQVSAGVMRAPERPTGLLPKRVPLVRLAKVQAPGARWDGKGTLVVSEGGVEVVLPQEQRRRRFEMSFDNNDRYEVALYRGTHRLGSQVIRRRGDDPNSGLVVRRFEFTDDVIMGGYDMVKIVPESGDGRYSIGHLKIW